MRPCPIRGHQFQQNIDTILNNLANLASQVGLSKGIEYPLLMLQAPCSNLAPSLQVPLVNLFAKSLPLMLGASSTPDNILEHPGWVKEQKFQKNTKPYWPIHIHFLTCGDEEEGDPSSIIRVHSRGLRIAGLLLIIP